MGFKFDDRSGDFLNHVELLRRQRDFDSSAISAKICFVVRSPFARSFRRFGRGLDLKNLSSRCFFSCSTVCM